MRRENATWATRTCIGVDALGENPQGQQRVDEREQSGGRSVGGEQGGGVGSHDAVGDPNAAGHGLHRDGYAEVPTGAVPREADPLGRRA